MQASYSVYVLVVVDSQTSDKHTYSILLTHLTDEPFSAS